MQSIKSLMQHGIVELKNYIKVCLVGLVGLSIQLITFNILRHFILPQYANAIGTELAIISNFLLNNSYSFKQHKISPSDHGYRGMVKKAFHFNIVSLLSFFVQFFVVSIGVHLFGRGAVVENLLVFIGIGLGSLLNYFTYSRFIWKKQK